MKKLIIVFLIALFGNLKSQEQNIEPFKDINDIIKWDYFTSNSLYNYRILFNEKKTSINGIFFFNGSESKTVTVYFKEPLTKETVKYIKDRKKSIYYDRRILRRTIKHINIGNSIKE